MSLESGKNELKMAQIGRIQEFQPDNESVTAYLERVDLYFVANGTAAETKVPVLLSSIGARTYGLLRSLVSPAAPREKTLKELEVVLKNHYEPAPLIIAERFQFHRRNQAVGESIAEYVAELRRLSTHCKFNNYLEQALRDRLVCGLRNEGTRKRLLSEADITLAKALELAQGFEAAEKNVQQFKETGCCSPRG